MIKLGFVFGITVLDSVPDGRKKHVLLVTGVIRQIMEILLKNE